MSVSLDIKDTTFNIKAANKPPALAALKSAQALAVSEASTLEDALHWLAWEATNGDTPATADDIVRLGFEGDRYGDEDVIFKILAPFVESGSTIEAEADGSHFRWRFENGKLFIDSGRIAYEGDEQFIRLIDAADENNRTIPARIRITNQGIGIDFDGYGTNTCEPGHGQPIWIEVYEGHPRVAIWANVNDEDPTHSVSLEKAQDKLRL